MTINRTNIEIEFKCLISKEKYDSLLREFNCKDEIKTQTNYYFDTENNDLKNNKIVLRIRQKGEQYKLTSKVTESVGLKESHVYLTKTQALDMLENGFDASIIGLNFFVKSKISLTTKRVSFPYKSGKLFFDHSIYFDVSDYEIEFEADSYDEGLKEFEEFLQKHDITYIKPKSKFIRAYEKEL